MDNNFTNRDIGVRFTDTKYAKRVDVRNELQTSNIDPFWVKIISYRAKYTKNLSLLTSNKLNYFICVTPSIGKQIEDISKKLNYALNTFNELDDELKSSVLFEAKKNIVKNVALYYGETVTEDFASQVVNGVTNNIQGLIPAKKKAIQYFKVHESLADSNNSINSDYIYNIYLKFMNKTPSQYVYRNEDANGNPSDFIGVSSNIIERMMDNLFRFFLDTRITPIVKASIAYFFINFVKPFNGYNEEIALLIFKSVLANNDLEVLPYLISFESFLNKKEEFMLEFKEVVRGNDMTYALLKSIELANIEIDKFINLCSNITIEVMEEEHHLKEDEPETKEEAVEESKEAPIEVKKEVNKPKHIEVKKNKNISISAIETSLDEKDANKFEKYLLERDPRLSKKEAHFYARHCTLGSYYTIQMFKKKERTVYETARTSMDSLTNLGYYRKEKIKNKHIYTPLKIERN